MPEMFRRITAATEWFVGFVREVNHGIAVERGYAPVGKRTRRGRGASQTCGATERGKRTARGRMRAHRAGRRGAGGRS